MKWIGRRLTYANVISTLALFVALSGGAFAASKLTSSGVLSLCVSRSGAVRALGRQRRCSKGTLLTKVNERGPAGPRGPAGSAGSAGPVGAAGAPSPAYSAGSGLTLSGTTFGADLSQLQARIAGSGCAADQALQSVTQNGSAACASLHAYSAVAGSDLPDADAAVPPGHWLLLGQVTAGNANGAMTVTCEIDVGGQHVASASQFVSTSAKDGTVSLIATTTTTAAPATAIGTNCSTDGPLPLWSDGAIVAIPVAALN